MITMVLIAVPTLSSTTAGATVAADGEERVRVSVAFDALPWVPAVPSGDQGPRSGPR